MYAENKSHQLRPWMDLGIKLMDIKARSDTNVISEKNLAPADKNPSSELPQTVLYLLI